MTELTFGVSLGGWVSTADLLEAARRAEEGGIDTVTVADHLGAPAPFQVLAAAAVVTERVRLRTYVLNAYFWHAAIGNAALLAREVATLDIPVLLVDGDLRRPALHDALGLQRSPGVSDVLMGSNLTRAAVSVPGVPRLQFLPAGTPVQDPAGLLGGASLPTIVRQAPHAEFVVVDTPASDFFADSMALSAQCDITLVVVNAQHSRRRALRKLMAELRQVHARPIGVVVNLAPTAARSAQYYYARSRRPA
jgi:hypothetical protein